MLLRLILAVAVIIALISAYRHYKKQPKAIQKQLAWKFISIGIIGVVLLLIVMGRVHWITGLFAAIVPFIQRAIPLAVRLLPFLSHWQKQRSGKSTSSGNISEVATDYLSMQLDHDSGEMTGTVLDGEYQGKSLEQLTKHQLQNLFDYLNQHDKESVQLLQAYLQRKFSDDEFSHEEYSTGSSENNNSASSSSSEITEKEALAVLGLKDGATREEILQAHKKLMQKLHPDRGGSDFLAAKVNQAKDFLTK